MVNQDEVKLTARKQQAWIRVPLDEDGWPLSHGERMVEVEPGVFMDRDMHDLMTYAGLDCHWQSLP